MRKYFPHSDRWSEIFEKYTPEPHDKRVVPDTLQIWERRPFPPHVLRRPMFSPGAGRGPTRLMSYHSASCVIAGEDVTNEDGKAVSRALLSSFGYTDFRFQPDEKRSKYYMPDPRPRYMPAIPFMTGRSRDIRPVFSFGAR